MTPTAHIRHFHALHHVADDAGARRAMAAQRRLLDGELEAALARVAAPAELILVRHLSARVRLGPEGNERDDARAWSDALLLSLEAALQHGGPQQLLRFASRQQALRAFAADALQAQATRDWAWQRLGLLPANAQRRCSDQQRRQGLLRLLADDSEQGQPLLRCLLFSQHWPALVASLQEAELRGLALVVLAHQAGLSAPAFVESPDAMSLPWPADAGAKTAQRAESEHTPPWWQATLQAAGTAARGRWALRLALMLAVPAWSRRGAAAVDARLWAWASRMVVVRATPDAEADGHRTLPRTTSQDMPGPYERVQREQEPALGLTPDRPAASQRQSVLGRGRIRSALDSASPAQTPSEAAEPPPFGEAVCGQTRCGGLMFLPPMLPLCHALPLLEDQLLWPELPQALHALALQLWPLAADDPAALAFCGLTPQQAPPPALAMSPAQQACLAQVQERLLDHLSQRLPDWPGPGLLARLLCRDARISADPGWLDVHFDLREVSLDLRRAAIDLDPGFLPWMGVVLRYHYE